MRAHARGRAKDTVRSWNEGERLVQEIYVTGGQAQGRARHPSAQTEVPLGHVLNVF